MPSLVITLANPYVAGLILAAPYGAVMSTVSGWLLIVSSGLVRDLYQRFLRPTASEREIAWASYAATVAIGLVVGARGAEPAALLADHHRLLEHGDGLGLPDARRMLGGFWRRATAAGAIAAMATGTFVTVGLYALGYFGPEPSRPLLVVRPRARRRRTASLASLLPGRTSTRRVWGLGSSLLVGVLVSLFTTPPDAPSHLEARSTPSRLAARDAPERPTDPTGGVRPTVPSHAPAPLRLLSSWNRRLARSGSSDSSRRASSSSSCWPRSRRWPDMRLWTRRAATRSRARSRSIACSLRPPCRTATSRSRE